MSNPRFYPLILAVLIFIVPARAQITPTQSGNLPFGSVATSDDVWSLQYNPAGLGMDRGLQIYYLHSYQDSSFEGNNALFTSWGTLGFSAEWLGIGSPVTYQKYTIGQGLPLGRKIFLGYNYSWFESRNRDYDKLAAWSLGFLARPIEQISYGLKIGDLNHPTFLGKRETLKFNYGIALRPFSQRVTLAFEGMTHENKAFFSDADFNFLAEVELFSGLHIQGQIDDQGDNYSLSAKVNLPGLSIGSSNFLNKKDGFQGGASYLGLSSQRHSTKFQRKNNFIVLALGGDLPEEARRGAYKSKQRTLGGILQTIKKAAEDQTVTGLLVRLDPLSCGLGKIQELREALKDFKAGHKNVIVFMETGGTKEYYLASLADNIVMVPTGYLDFSGLTAQVIFLKGTLEKLGIVADLEHIGKYKSASDLLTRDSMSEAHQEVVNSVLDDLFDQLVGQIADERGWSKEEIREKVNQGPFTAKEAYQAGLVDKLAFADEIEEMLKETPSKKLSLLASRPKLISEGIYNKRKPYRTNWGVPPKIAVIYVTGLITSGGSGGDLLLGNTVGSQTIAGAIRRARDDNSVKAIVLRIDSGGGSGLASDVIWRELKLAQRRKPVIVSMSDLAASGGYFVAIPGEEILANPATLTGSIGVISGKFNLAGLYRKIGFNIQTEKRGDHADLSTSTRSYTDQEREIIRRQTKEFYSDFIAKVAEGRELDTLYVDSIGQGRVWTGSQAKEKKLIDRFGGLLPAIELAKQKAGLKREDEVEIVWLPRYRSRWPLGLDRMFGFMVDLEQVRNLWEGEFPLENDHLLYLSPYQLEIK